MKVELDLDANQLELLDKGLKDCLLSLSEEQQVMLIQNYMNAQFEDFKKPKDKISYWNNTEYEYTDFGKQVIETLSDKIEASITTSIFEKENVKQLIDEKIEEVIKNIPAIIESSISKYIINNLFRDKATLENEIRCQFFNLRNN